MITGIRPRRGGRSRAHHRTSRLPTYPQRAEAAHEPATRPEFRRFPVRQRRPDRHRYSDPPPILRPARTDPEVCVGFLDASRDTVTVRRRASGIPRLWPEAGGGAIAMCRPQSHGTGSDCQCVVQSRSSAASSTAWRIPALSRNRSSCRRSSMGRTESGMCVGT